MQNTIATEIKPDQILNVLHSENFQGRYVAKSDDPNLLEKWIAIDKASTPPTIRAYFTEETARSSFGNERLIGAGREIDPLQQPAIESIPVESIPAVTPGPPQNGHYPPQVEQPEETPSVEAQPEPETAETAEPEDVQPEQPLTWEEKILRMSDDELVGAIRKVEAAYFAEARVVNSLDAQFKAKQEKFNKENAELIQERKAATNRRDSVVGQLKFASTEYAERYPNESEFDLYIKFRNSKTYDFDEPKGITWAEKNYPAAIVNHGPQLDLPRIKAYVNDLVKRKEPLPDFVTVESKRVVTLATTIPASDEELEKANS